MTVQLEQVLELPLMAEYTVPAEWIDANGHMNVMYYTALGNMALGRLFKLLGLPRERFASKERGTFALQQVINYLNELREGDKVEVHTYFVGHDAKRLHFIHYVVNVTKGKIASTDERIAMYIDMATRRSTNFEPEISASLDRAQASFTELDWTPEVSGVIKLKK